MATIISEVFRFVNLRSPKIKKNTSPLATPIVRPKAISRATNKPAVVPQEKWDNLLIQKLIAAKNDPANESKMREAMEEVFDDLPLREVPEDTFYINFGIQEVVDFADWIDINAHVLDKAELRNRFIQLYNKMNSEEEPISIETYTATIEGEDMASMELMLWDILAGTTLKYPRPNFAKGVARSLMLLNLAKELSNYEAFPTDSSTIYELFNSPIDLPGEIFPLPKFAETIINEPEPDLQEEELTAANENLKKWLSAQITIDFVKRQMQEKQQRMLHEFTITYDENNVPTNLENMPKIEQKFLTPDSLEEHTQRCATTIGLELVTGKEKIIEQFLCSPTSKYSVSYIEHEITQNIKTLQQIITLLTPRKVLKTVMVDGTIFTYEDITRGEINQ